MTLFSKTGLRNFWLVETDGVLKEELHNQVGLFLYCTADHMSLSTGLTLTSFEMLKSN